MRWFHAACYILIALALSQELVKDYKKDMMGAQRSLGDMVHGFPISFSIVWWFPAPTAFLAAATLCFGMAWMKIA